MSEKHFSIQSLLKEKDSWRKEVRSSLSALCLRFKAKWDHFRCRCQCFCRGYSHRDVQEMQDWFLRNAKPMLQTLSQKYYDYPPELSEEQWYETLAEMAHLSDLMDPWDDSPIRTMLGLSADDNSDQTLALIDKARQKAKDRFFFLFGKWFYDL